MASVCLLRCPVFWSPFLSCLLMLSPGCVGKNPLLPAPTALPAAARAGRHKSCLSAAFGRQLMDGSALLWKLLLCYRCWAGDEHSAAVSLGTGGNFWIFICCNGEWQKGILHEHVLKDLQPFPAQWSKLGFPVAAAQISLLKSCGLILEHKYLCQGCCARLEQGLFLS